MSARGDSRGARWLGLALCLVVAQIGFRAVFEMGLLGWDSYPIIVSARLTGEQGVLANLTQELMAGRYTDGSFWRPLLGYSVALDHALFGLAPAGYHAHDLAWIGLAAWALGCVAGRLTGSRAASIGAAALFLLHPVLAETAPVMPRRAETMATAFTALAVLGALGPRTRMTPVLVGLLATAAALSKESGLLAAPLVTCAWFLRAGDEAAGSRLARAMRASLPAWSGAGLYLLARTAVLGGLGGHDESGLEQVLLAPRLAAPYLERTLAAPAGVPAVLAGVFPWLAGALLVGSSAWRSARSADARAALALLGAWWLGVLLFSALSGRVHEWYVQQFVAPVAVLAGAGLASCRGEGRACRVLALGAASLLLLSFATRSPLTRGLPLWRHADELRAAQLAEVRAEVERTTPGSGVILPEFVTHFSLREGTDTVRMVLSDYSVQAWLDLTLPRRPATVSLSTGGPPPPIEDPTRVHVVLETLAHD